MCGTYVSVGIPQLL